MIVHSTNHISPPDRASAWSGVIANVYFPLKLTYRSADSFQGQLASRPLGRIGLSRLQTEPLQYERLPRHISGTAEEEFLVTIPQKNPILFRQMNREVRCDPGGFILERGDAPYRFSYDNQNDLYVIKVPKPLLAGYVHNPDRYCAMVFSGNSGMGGLFSEMARRIHNEDAVSNDTATRVLGRHLLELLTLALENSDSADPGTGTAVRAAHLGRVETVIRDNLTNPALSPELIANACGISKRYLHELFKDVNGTVSQKIRDQRLTAARDMLELARTKSIADIAYHFGFSDQAQFSRLFKAMFGQPPSDYRRQTALQRSS
jgi:AraC-like DNA-binding protein